MEPAIWLLIILSTGSQQISVTQFEGSEACMSAKDMIHQKVKEAQIAGAFQSPAPMISCEPLKTQ